MATTNDGCFARWRGRIGLVAAAVASMATSGVSWGIRAPLTREVVPDGQVYRYTITASVEPYVETLETRSGIVAPDVATPPSPRTGPQVVDVYAGSKLESVLVSSPCEDQGFCSNECDPPDDAFVSVTGPEILAGWSKSVEATADVEQTLVAVSCDGGEGATIEVALSGGPFANLTFTATSPDVTATDVRTRAAAADESRYIVHVLGPAAVTAKSWTITATARGVCTEADAGPCAAPADVIEIQSVRATACDQRDR